MAPDGQFSASATTFSTLAASGWIHSPLALGTKTCGLPSTQLREWIQRLPEKETLTFSPSTVPAMGGVSCVGDRLGPGCDGRQATSSPFPPCGGRWIGAQRRDG